MTLKKSPQSRISGGKADKREQRRRNGISWQMRQLLAQDYHGPACGCDKCLGKSES